MAQRILELTLISASNLKDVNFFSDMEVYAVVSLNGDPRTRHQTQTDYEGETDPTWDETLVFAVPPTAAAASASAAYLHVILRTERLFGEDRDVGEVFISVADLLAGACAGATPPRCASYPVRKVQRNNGKRRGMLSVSYRLGPVMVPLLPETGCWNNDPYPLPPWEQWDCYPPTYMYMQEGQQETVPRYPPAGVRMPPALMPSGGGGAAASAGMKNVGKNRSFAPELGVGLLGGGFERMLFQDMPSSNTAAHKSV
uniref:Uncharacterized protein n=1 Tax=Avena sativa TaxID=4498 RepID=A0ACD5Z1F2_AVESA